MKSLTKLCAGESIYRPDNTSGLAHMKIHIHYLFEAMLSLSLSLSLSHSLRRRRLFSRAWRCSEKWDHSGSMAVCPACVRIYSPIMRDAKGQREAQNQSQTQKDATEREPLFGPRLQHPSEKVLLASFIRFLLSVRNHRPISLKRKSFVRRKITNSDIGSLQGSHSRCVGHIWRGRLRIFIALTWEIWSDGKCSVAVRSDKECTRRAGNWLRTVTSDQIRIRYIFVDFFLYWTRRYVSLNRNYWEAMNLLTVLPGLYLNILKTEEVLQFWDKIFTTFQCKSLRR